VRRSFSTCAHVAGIALAAVCASSFPCGAEAQVRGPAFTLRKSASGQPMLLDSTYGFTGGFNPGAGRHDGSLGFNSDTEVLYGIDLTDSGYEIARMDPGAEYPKSGTFTNSGMGTTRTYLTSGYHFRGTVAGGASVGVGQVHFTGSYDPYMVTGSYTGLMSFAASGGTPTWREYVAQTAGEELGQSNEGSVAAPHDTSARVTDCVLQDSVGALGGSGHWWGLEVDRFKGQFIAADGAGGGQIGPRLVSRYFMGIPVGAASSGPLRRIVVAHADAARTNEPTATTVGTRLCYLRNRSAAGADCTLLTTAQMDDLVPGVADVGRDMAQDPQTGDLYIISTVDTGLTNAYLTAVRPNIPDVSTNAMSFQVVDLDPDSDNAHLDLSALHTDLRWGSGITFNHDGSRLYISVMSAAGGAVRAVYALDRRVPIPKAAVILFW
jgi:hypothetical protein